MGPLTPKPLLLLDLMAACLLPVLGCYKGGAAGRYPGMRLDSILFALGDATPRPVDLFLHPHHSHLDGAVAPVLVPFAIYCKSGPCAVGVVCRRRPHSGAA